MDGLTLDQLHAQLKLAATHKRYRAWDFFKPVPKQMEFFALGVEKFERMLMAGNGNGKTEAAGFEVSCHMLGEYPEWWPGYRFTKPVRVWAGGTSAKMVREGSQTKLLGAPGVKEMLGTGFIPRESLVGEPQATRGVSDSVDSFQVRNALGSGAISRLVFKTYEQDRKDWQGADIDLLWPDEEPPLPIYTEGMARLRGRGRSLMTFTPLMGMSDVVCRFLENDDPTRGYVKMGLNDANWYTPQEKAQMISSYPPHERAARANGDPLLGSGKVFSTPESDLAIDPIPLDRIPLEWVKIWGIDFGMNHPFGAVLLCWNRGTDHYYLLHVIRMADALPLQHADAIKRIAANVPVAWPHDGHQRDRMGSGDEMAQIYGLKGHKLNMLSTHATHPTGGYSVYAGVMQLEEVMRAGRFHVDRTLTKWFEEYGQYHYKDGQIVKVRDDLMDATRIAWMMRRHAKAVALGGRRISRGPVVTVRSDADTEHWGY